jgi:hypothetical protein
MTVIRQSSPFPSSFFDAAGGGIVMAGKELAGCPYPRAIAMKSRFPGYRRHGARLELNRSRGQPERVLTTDNTDEITKSDHQMPAGAAVVILTAPSVIRVIRVIRG